LIPKFKWVVEPLDAEDPCSYGVVLSWKRGLFLSLAFHRTVLTIGLARVRR
jgi:hypothetical protein